MNDLSSIPAVFMRGGTSKGLIFHKNHLPKDKKTLTQYLLKIMGSPDMRQINGMGSGTSVTSKVCIISKSLEKNIDILKDEIMSFIEAIKFGKSPLVSGEDGKKALEVCLEIMDRIRS